MPDAAETDLSEHLGTYERLDAALSELRPADLHLITLVVLEDVSLADAADVLGLTAGAAKTRMHRARTRLRTSLADHPAARHLLATAEGPHS